MFRHEFDSHYPLQLNMNYKLLICGVTAGYSGTDSYDAYIKWDDESDEDFENMLYEEAVEHADGYGIYPESDRPFYEDGDEEDEGYGRTQYSADICGWIEDEYTAETAHDLDGNKSGGGSFANDFIRLLKAEYEEVPQWLLDYVS